MNIISDWGNGTPLVVRFAERWGDLRRLLTAAEDDVDARFTRASMIAWHRGARSQPTFAEGHLARVQNSLTDAIDAAVITLL